MYCLVAALAKVCAAHSMAVSATGKLEEAAYTHG